MKEIKPSSPTGNARFGAAIGISADGQFVAVGASAKSNTLGSNGEAQFFKTDGNGDYLIYDSIPGAAANLFTASLNRRERFKDLLVGTSARSVQALSGRNLSVLAVDVEIDYAAQAIAMNNDGFCLVNAKKLYTGDDQGTPFTDATGVGVTYDPDLANEPPSTQSVEAFETSTVVSDEVFTNDTSYGISEDRRVCVMGNIFLPDSRDDVRIFTNTTPAGDGKPYDEVQTIASTRTDAHRLGRSLSVSSDGVLIALAEMSADDTDLEGFVYIYEETSPELWTLKDTLNPASQPINMSFGGEIATSDGFDRIVVSAGTDVGPSGEVDYGSFYVYKFNGTTWDEEAKLYPGADGVGKAWSVSISGDGTKIALGDVTNDTVWMYEFTTQWDLIGDYATPGDPAASYGNPVRLSNDGNWLAVGARFQDTEASASGSVYVWDLVNDPIKPPTP